MPIYYELEFASTFHTGSAQSAIRSQMVSNTILLMADFQFQLILIYQYAPTVNTAIVTSNRIKKSGMINFNHFSNPILTIAREASMSPVGLIKKNRPIPYW